MIDNSLNNIEWLGAIPEEWKYTEIGRIYSERKEKVQEDDLDDDQEKEF